jgi:methionine-rich copper-binding protein CopC
VIGDWVIGKRVLLVLVVVLVVLGLGVGGVMAHAELVSAVPAPGAALSERLEEIRLTFSEAVGPGSSIVVFGEGFREIEGITAEINPDLPQQMTAAIPNLDPGTYSVQWTVISADGHPAAGSYSFQLLPEAERRSPLGLIVGSLTAAAVFGVGLWLWKRPKTADS